MLTSDDLSRRRFLYASGSFVLGATLTKNIVSASSENSLPFSPLKKAIQWSNLPKNKSEMERCEIAKRCGFDGIELPPIEDAVEIEKILDAVKKNGLTIHSIIYGGWDKPLSHPDPSIAEEGKKRIIKNLKLAKQVGADTLLLVPAVVNERVRYKEAWERSTKHIKELIQSAEENNVVIAVENVWNKFLLSPLEFCEYIDQFNSPYVRAYFDIGNVVIFGYPEDWIRTLSNRIVKIHVKDFKRNGYQWSSLPYEGDVNWSEVRKALHEVNYKGWITEEFPGGDENYLKELSHRMDLFIQGKEKV
ncbi:MAG: sugar phosphate isomerase/epimerase [Candidatus Hydrogenedentes bacterium]|nr:sugar phosphate isomerase/epimerase [Candidatus Hydrogenedentota bacterium]